MDPAIAKFIILSFLIPQVFFTVCEIGQRALGHFLKQHDERQHNEVRRG